MFEFKDIGRNIRERRRRFGLSARELAEKAGISRNTFVRLEAGHPCHLATIEKLRRALSMAADQVLRPADPAPFRVHRSGDSRWSVAVPPSEYRRLREDEDPRHVNDPVERRRLGALGFQPAFTAVLDSELTGGVTSHAIIEVHGRGWVTNHYGEEFVYCLRGSVIVTVDEVPCRLEEGDALGFDATHPHRYEPAYEITPTTPIPLILAIVTMRPGEQLPPPIETPYKLLNW